MNNPPLAKHLASVLRDPTLFASILKMNNQEISELSQALQAALTVARNCVYLRTHEESPS